jgi:hypothetical protein
LGVAGDHFRGCCGRGGSRPGAQGRGAPTVRRRASLSRIPLDDLVEVVFEAVPDGNDLFANIDLVTGYRIDMGQRDDKATMYADELLGRQFVGERLEVAEREDRLGSSPDIDLGIIFHPFAEEDVLEPDLDDLVFRLYEDESVVAVMDIDGSGQIVPDLIHRRKKSFEGQGSDQVTEDVHLRFFVFLFLFVGDADDDGIVTRFFEAEHDAVIEETEVPKDDIGAMLYDEGIDVRSRFAFAGEGKLWRLGDIVLQQRTLLVVILHDNTV